MVIENVALEGEFPEHDEEVATPHGVVSSCQIEDMKNKGPEHTFRVIIARA
jgi:hypothetical protein